MLSTVLNPETFIAVRDDFNRANEGPLPLGNWSAPLDAGDDAPLYIVSNELKNPGIRHSFGSAYWNRQKFGPDCAMEFRQGTLPSQVYVFIRANNVNTTSLTGYAAQWYSGTSQRFYRVDGTTYTQIGSNAGVPGGTFSTGDILTLKIVGETLTAFKNGVSFNTASDSTYRTEGYVGVDVANDNFSIDDLWAGNLGRVTNVRQFNRTVHDLIHVGLAAESGFGTLLAIIRRNGNNDSHGAMSLNDGSTNHAELFVNDNASGNQIALWTGVANLGTLTLLPSDGWAIVAVTKATGSALPRFHRCLLSGPTWSHANATTAAIGNWSTADTRITIGESGNGFEAHNGELALVAYFNGVVLSDLTLETFKSVADILAASPTSLWTLDQSIISLPVIDLPGTSDQTAISGTSVFRATVPNFDFSNALPSGSDTGVGTDSQTVTNAAIGPVLIDQFRRADTSSGINAEWAGARIQGADVPFKIDGNACRGTTSAFASDYWKDPRNADVAVAVTVVNTTDVVYLIARLKNPGGGSETFVWAGFDPDADTITLGYSNAGVTSTRLTVSAAVNYGDRLVFTAIGPTLKAYVNGAEVANVQSSIVLTPGNVGVQAQGVGVGALLDDFMATTGSIPVISDDTGSGSDSQTINKVTADTGTDTETQTLTAQISSTDAGTDSETSVLVTKITDTDTGTDSESQSVIIPSVPISGSDTGTDSESATLVAQISSADTGSGVDASTLVAQISSADTGTDAEASTLVAQISNTDTGTDAEATTLVVVISGTDTGTDTETGIPNKLSADAGTDSETSTLTAAYSSADTGTDSESTTLVAVISGTDTGTDSETGVTIHYGADTGSGADAQTLTAAISDIDTGTDTETQTPNKFTTDAGVGSDSQTLISAYTNADTGTDSEANVLTAQISTTETGSGTDNGVVSTLNAKNDADTGVGTDIATVVAVISSAETGTDSEFTVIRLPAVSDTGASFRHTFNNDGGSGANKLGTILQSLGPGSIVIRGKWSGTQISGFGSVAGYAIDYSGSGFTQCVLGLNGTNPATAKLIFHAYSVGAGSALGATSVGNGVSRHVVATWNGNVQKLYLDAVLDGTGSQTGSAMNSGATGYLRVGQNIIGDVPQILAYNKELSQAEVTALCNGARPTSISGLIFWAENDGIYETAQISSTDAASDSENVIQTVQISVADSGTSSESGSASIGVTPRTDSDSGFGSDSQALSAVSSGSDGNSTSTDAAALRAAYSTSENGSGIDAISIRWIVASETGIGVETTSLGISSADTGIGYDTATLEYDIIRWDYDISTGEIRSTVVDKPTLTGSKVGVAFSETKATVVDKPTLVRGGLRKSRITTTRIG